MPTSRRPPIASSSTSLCALAQPDPVPVARRACGIRDRSTLRLRRAPPRSRPRQRLVVGMDQHFDFGERKARAERQTEHFEHRSRPGRPAAVEIPVPEAAASAIEREFEMRPLDRLARARAHGDACVQSIEARASRPRIRPVAASSAVMIGPSSRQGASASASGRRQRRPGRAPRSDCAPPRKRLRLRPVSKRIAPARSPRIVSGAAAPKREDREPRVRRPAPVRSPRRWRRCASANSACPRPSSGSAPRTARNACAGLAAGAACDRAVDAPRKFARRADRDRGRRLEARARSRLRCRLARTASRKKTRIAATGRQEQDETSQRRTNEVARAKAENHGFQPSVGVAVSALVRTRLLLSAARERVIVNPPKPDKCMIGGRATTSRITSIRILVGIFVQTLM